MMMPHAIRFNSAVVEDRYIELAHMLPDDAGNPNALASERLAETMKGWLQIAGMSTSLRELAGWPSNLNEDTEARRSFLMELAINASKQWTASFNPRAASVDDFFELYRAAL
jgi:alcohol dehydrogenase class IV